MTSTNHMHRASAPGSGSLDLSLAGRRASRRTRSQRVAVVVAQVGGAGTAVRKKLVHGGH